VDVETRALRPITRARGPWSSPALSPDGRRIAFVGFPWTEQTYKANELWVVDRDGSNPRRLSGEFDRSPASLLWSADGKGVYFTCEDRGTSNVWFASEDGNVRQLTHGVHMLSLSSRSKNGLAVGLRTAPQEPADVVRFSLADGKGMARLTKVNDDILAGRKLGAVEEIWYESTGKTAVQGWIVKPPDFDEKKKYPLILHIHGGPHAMYSVAFNASFQMLAAQGYVGLYTNPRGSTGYGTAFGNAIDNAYPGVDYDDLMAGVDAVVARGYVDPDRLYVTGASGGGVLSSWMIAHTDRFAAAAVRCPVINWISFAGTTDITAWGFYRFRKRPWEDPAHWLKHSPLMHVARVKTPTLLMTGELDLRTPMAQTEEYYQALRALGVPTAMVRFHDEYHGTESKPSNFMRTQLYLLEWFGRHRARKKGE
jgi:dipeptidyl aminopeptidase/acylaminoacyl peptidase